MYRTILSLLVLACFLVTVASATMDQDRQALATAEALQLKFRQGTLDDVAPLVKLLEAAVKRSPDNADLRLALGHAHMSTQAQLLRLQAPPAELVHAGEQARDAYARARKLNEHSALALAGHGMAGLTIALISQDESGIASSVEQMNEAVREAPSALSVRLTRAFTIIHLPAQIRDSRRVIEDLKFIMDEAYGERAQDVLHMLLGDVYAEIGDLANAMQEYKQVGSASAFAAEQARSRFDELKRGAIAPASIAQVRSGLGLNCAMCHAPGTDH